MNAICSVGDVLYNTSLSLYGCSWGSITYNSLTYTNTCTFTYSSYGYITSYCPNNKMTYYCSNYTSLKTMQCTTSSSVYGEFDAYYYPFLGY